MRKNEFYYVFLRRLIIFEYIFDAAYCYHELSLKFLEVYLENKDDKLIHP